MKKIRFFLTLLSLFTLVGCDDNDDTVYRIETFKGGNFQLSLKKFKYGLYYSGDKNKEAISLVYTLHSDFDQIKELEHYMGSYTAVFDNDKTRGHIDYVENHAPSIAPDETITIAIWLYAFKDWESFVLNYKSRDINYNFKMNKADYPCE